MEITMEMIKKLKDRTGLGIMDCKKALAENNGDEEKAIEYLRKQGVLKAAKKSARDANEGLVHAYIHTGSKLGVMVEVNCETDFVAKTKDFYDMTHQIAVHIAAAEVEPQYVNIEDVPAELLEKEKSIYAEQMKATGKPANVIEKIVENKIKKYCEDICLMSQEFFGSEVKKTVSEYIKENIAKFGENIKVSRFVVFKIGD
ncbi:MAG: translation elongation factor Ts [bacterium]|nr:translation elongation factor Ts [bacterium]